MFCVIRTPRYIIKDQKIARLDIVVHHLLLLNSITCYQSDGHEQLRPLFPTRWRMNFQVRSAIVTYLEKVITGVFPISWCHSQLRRIVMTIPILPLFHSLCLPSSVYTGRFPAGLRTIDQ